MINIKKTGIFYAITLGLMVSGSAHATVITGAVTSGGGSFIELSLGFTDSTPNNTVGDDNFQNLNLYAFNEDQNTSVLNNPLNVDILASTGLAGTLDVGTIVASHYLFFDPLNMTSQSGWVDFDSDILAVITSSGNLNASDYLANTGVTYLSSGLRGLEWNDSVTIDSGNAARVNVDWRAGTPGDYVRVLTTYSPGAVSVPEPGMLALLGLGLAGIGIRRKRAKAA